MLTEDAVPVGPTETKPRYTDDRAVSAGRLWQVADSTGLPAHLKAKLLYVV